MAAAAWLVVAAQCAGGANATVNSDASCLLYRPAEADQVYTPRLADIICRLIAGCTLCTIDLPSG